MYIKFQYFLDGYEFRMKYPRPFYMDFLKWKCGDECDYDCMWKTVEGFQERNYNIPQFFGKVRSKIYFQLTQ